MTCQVIDLPPRRRQGGRMDAESTTTDSTTTDSTTTADRYLAALNEPDPALRRELIAAAWSPLGSLTDPPAGATGHEGVAAIADGLHAQFPGHAFRRTSGVDGHHDRIRFGWELVAPDGTPVLTGLDVADVMEDGRVGAVTGFFGDLPSLA